MSSIQETLKKSREVQEQYLRFLKEKEQTDKRWKETEDRIDRTLAKLADTKEDIKKVDQLYENYMKSFDDMVNAAIEKIQKHQLLEKAAEDFEPVIGDPKKVAQLLKSKKKICVLTGAGVSSASGIPTFRDLGGFWSQKKAENIQPEIFLTHSNFQENPLQIWEWVESFYIVKEKCKPNLGHACLDAFCANVRQKGHEVCIVTQNIDGFHLEGQSPSSLFKNEQKDKYPIYQIHGNVTKVRCDNCSSGKEEPVFYPYEEQRAQIMKGKAPRCPQCQGQLRPHVMLFDEFYTQKFNKSESVKAYCLESDVLIVVGTALQTGLARMLVESFLERQEDIIEVNTECIIKQPNTIWFQGKSEEFLVQICNSYY